VCCLIAVFVFKDHVGSQRGTKFSVFIFFIWRVLVQGGTAPLYNFWGHFIFNFWGHFLKTFSTIFSRGENFTRKPNLPSLFCHPTPKCVFWSGWHFSPR
jgi:ABC-type polysaccharide/polyol phosphate export permease